MYEKEIFEYNQNKKKLFGIWLITTLIVLIIISTIFTQFNLLEGTWIEKLIISIGSEIESNSLWGLFLVSLFGGLFFLPIPLEVTFIRAATENNPWVCIPIMLSGLLISYPLDYMLGSKFSSFSRKLISAKQFYNIKAKINRHGKYAIFFFSALPAPSQAVTFICGVFKYNKIRYFVFSLTAWIIKLCAIALFLPLILKFF